ncbi:MAG: hypothetical protein DCC67_07515 [Planctomycetota bacterium]|nr:MAG: hypothetical protein DCC67_07515 [Planctomycetota bacterium]
MNRAAHIIFVCGSALALVGCLGSTAHQSMQHQTGAGPTGPRAGAAPAPDAKPCSLSPTAYSPAAQQSGQGNLTSQVDARGWTGIEYSRVDAVPIGQVVLMAMMLVLSHRREMARIRQNGHCHTSGTTGVTRYDIKPPRQSPKSDAAPVGQGADHVHPASQRSAARTAKGPPRGRSR